MTKPRLTTEERESMDAVSQLCDDPAKNGIRKALAIVDEHAAAMALLGSIREWLGKTMSCGAESQAHRIDELLGKKAPTLEEFALATNESKLRHCFVPHRLDGGHRTYVSDDGFRLARVTVAEDKLRVAAHDLSQSRNESGRFPDAPSAVEFVARFLGVES